MARGLAGSGRQIGLMGRLDQAASSSDSLLILNTAMSDPPSTPSSGRKSGCRTMSWISRSTLYFSPLNLRGDGPVSHSPQRISISAGSISTAPGFLPHLMRSSLQPLGCGVQQQASSRAPFGPPSLQRYVQCAGPMMMVGWGSTESRVTAQMCSAVIPFVRREQIQG